MSVRTSRDLLDPSFYAARPTIVPRFDLDGKSVTLRTNSAIVRRKTPAGEVPPSMR